VASTALLLLPLLLIFHSHCCIGWFTLLLLLLKRAPSFSFFRLCALSRITHTYTYTPPSDPHSRTPPPSILLLFTLLPRIRFGARLLVCLLLFVFNSLSLFASVCVCLCVVCAHCHTYTHMTNPMCMYCYSLQRLYSLITISLSPSLSSLYLHALTRSVFGCSHQ